MSFVLKDRVLETSVSTGTGDFVLGGAQTGYQGFITVGDGATVPYTIQGKNSDGTLNGEWEVGEGTYHLSGNYVSRDLVYESSNSNAKVSFSAGDKDIFLDLPSELISTVAITGSYTDLTNKPTIPAAQVNSDWTAVSGVAEILHKPTLGTAAALDAGVPNGVATLDSGGKVPTSQIPQMGDLNYQGTWNASTNTPTLTSSTGTKGYYYVVSVSGATNLDGITDWVIGDWAVFNGTVWQKIDNTDAVTSVNGYTGTVVLSYTDVGAAPATTGTSILYGNGSGGTSNVTVGTGLSFTGGTLSSSVSPMVYPGAGIPNSTGTAWGTSYTTTGTGTIVALQTNATLYNPNIDVIDFDTAYATTLTAGQLGWDGNNTLGIGMAGGNVIQRIGEDAYIYVKASSSITKGQLCMFTGVVGASSVITAAPSTGVTNGQYIVGLAAESITSGNFGLIQVMGSLKGFNTSAFTDGDVLYYDSAVTGGMTKTYPTSGPIVTVCAVTNAGSGGSGSVQIRVSVTQRITAGTGISVSQSSSGTSVTNTEPDQVVSLTGAGTTTVTGTYPNFTITSNDAYVGTVTSVSGIGTVNGITLTGTVTSAGSLTLGGTLSGIGNTQLTNSSVTFNGVTVALGASGTITAATPNALSAGTGLSYTSGTTFDGSAARTLNLANTAVSAGSYTLASITVDAQGRLTSASNGTAVTSIAGTANQITASASTGAVTVSIPTTAITTNWQASGGLYAQAAMTATYTDGIVVDYTTGSGRISVGTADNIIVYTGGVASTQMAKISSSAIETSGAFVVNSRTVAASYSIPSGSSATSAGPITISAGATVTVPSGSKWVVL